MSITKEVVIWCDICGNWERSIFDASKAWLEFKAKGWMRIKGGKKCPAKQDLCPLCAKKIEEKK